MRKFSSSLVLLAVLFVVSACVSKVSTPDPKPAEATPVPAIVSTSTPEFIPNVMPTQNLSDIPSQKAIDYLSAQLGIPTEKIRVISIDQVQWINACLGFQSPEEVCAEALTDGILVVLAAGEKEYELHMVLDGSSIRMKNTPTKDLPPEVERARQMLAKDLNLDQDEITLISFTEKNWPDACMGRSEPEMMCAQVITPGFEITFEVYGKQIIYAASSRNKAAFLVSNPFFHSGMRDVMIVLDLKTPNCQSALFSDTEVTAGDCGSDLVSYPYTDRDYWHQINWLAARYAPFEYQTEESSLRFASRGAQIASASEQRSIFEWAKIALMTSIQQVSGPDAGSGGCNPSDRRDCRNLQADNLASGWMGVPSGLYSNGTDIPTVSL